MNILLIGAGGSLGFELCRVLIKNKNKVVAVDISENALATIQRLYGIKCFREDICHFDKIKSIIKSHNIECVINCAALKHVRFCEENIEDAFELNVMANLNLSNFLKDKNIEFVFISSDKAYLPVNVYALTKQFAEYAVKQRGFKVVVGVNFMNSHGSVLEIWEQQRKYNQPFSVVRSDCIRYFMFIDEMADLVYSSVLDKTGCQEFVPQKVYKIRILELFDAFLSIHSLNKADIDIEYFDLSVCEKNIEDLNFATDIIDINGKDDLINMLTRKQI